MSQTETVTTEELLKQRGAIYGEFRNHSLISQQLKGCLENHYNNVEHMPISYERLDPFIKEGLEMICHKLGRIVNGNPNYVDSWTDIAGYAQLVAKQLEYLNEFNANHS
jgi:hypothetical protein